MSSPTQRSEEGVSVDLTAESQRSHEESAAELVFRGPGEMRALGRDFDWASTSLGPVEDWPRSLRTIVKTLLASRHPMFLWWGPDLVQIYNDAYRPSFASGGRHVLALGAKGPEFWTETWDIIGPQIVQVMSGGESTWHEDALAPIERNGHIEDAWWTYGYSPAFDDYGDVNGVLVVCHETTSRVRASQENAAARAEAEAANRAKSEFLTVMSHELRTPLNAIGGYVELLELGIRGAITDEQREDLARIRKSQRHLLGLINDVLNYTRIEAAAINYEIEAVLVDETLATCEALTTSQRRVKKLDFTFNRCGPTVAVRADRERLKQIIINLLTNAEKFTHPGGRIALDAEVRNDTVVITVRDTGRGIAATHLGRIFDPFVQVDAGLTRTQDGIGLGLAISRDLARAMGGDLTVESEHGVGSQFTLSLALAQPLLERPSISA
jgi:signal transduction histidine kinase